MKLELSTDQVALVLRTARESASAYELADKLGVNWATLDRRWRERRAAGANLPRLQDVIGRGTFQDEELTVPEHQLKMAELVEDERTTYTEESTETQRQLVVPPEAVGKKIPPAPSRVVPWDWSRPPPASMIVESDNHYALSDEAFQAAKFEFAIRNNVEHLFNLGDQHDFTSISRFDKDPAYANTIADDVDASNERHWKVADSIFKGIDFIEGNHDWRIYKMVMANHALFGLRVLQDWHTLGVPKKVRCHAYGTHVQIGHVWGEHGDQMKGQNPTYYAMQHRDAIVTVFGHTHKPGSYTRVLRNRYGQMERREAHNLGHGQSEKTCDLWAGTMKGWTHGFLYVEHRETEYGWDVFCHPIVVQRGEFVFNGRVYRG